MTRLVQSRRTSIRLYLSLLSNTSENRRATYLDSLSRETVRLQTLIESLLDISRLDLGKTTVHFKPTDLNALLTTLFTDRSKLFAERKLKLHLETSPDLYMAQSDPKLIEQVATNLLTNAMNYTASGGHVYLRTERREDKEQTWTTFSVRDTGPGIAKEEQACLFERFYRGAAGQNSNAPGTGLSLAICQEILNLHKGHRHITLESVLGEGSTFTVWLPGCEEL